MATLVSVDTPFFQQIRAGMDPETAEVVRAFQAHWMNESVSSMSVSSSELLRRGGCRFVYSVYKFLYKLLIRRVKRILI